MKYWLSLFLSLTFMMPFSVQATDMQSPIMQEIFYTMYEKQVRQEIENIMVERGIDRNEAILTIAFLKAQVDMLDVKNNVMACFKRKNIGFGQSENSVEAIKDCFYEYKDQLDVANLKSGTIENASKDMVVAGYFVPQYQEVSGDDNHKVLAIAKNIALNLAVSRMDVKYLYKDAINCLHDNEGKNRKDIFRYCTASVETSFRKELIKAMDELMGCLDFITYMMLKSEKRI